MTFEFEQVRMLTFLYLFLVVAGVVALGIIPAEKH